MTTIQSLFDQPLVQPLVSDEEKYHTRVWQERDLNYLSPMPYSANWSQMGAFKTSTGLWLMQRKKVRNALIVTSKMGKGAYFSDFYRCLPENWELYNLTIHKATLKIGEFEREESVQELFARLKRGNHNNPIVVLVHYDVLMSRANLSSKKKSKDGYGIVDRMKMLEWDMILCDEAHRMKSRDTQWTQSIKQLKAKNRHVMTGTGFINNPAEIYSLLNFLNPKEWSNYWAFRNYFCDQYVTPQGFRIIRGVMPGRKDEFRRLRKRLGPRNTMATVHKGIKKPIERIIEVDLNSAQRRMADEIKAVLRTLDEQGQPLVSPNVLSMLNRLRQINVATPKVVSRQFDQNQNRMVTEIELVEGSSKLDVVMDILEELDEDDQKVVVFSNFRDPLKLLATRLDKKSIGYVHMQQHHSEMQRYRMWRDEFRKPHNKVFMSTLALGGESINLSCAQYLIFLDRSWSPKDMLQAVGRVYRPGQEGAVEVIYINAKNTVDSYVKSKLDIKDKWFNDIFGD